jgi:hypothetical protein
LALLPKHPSTDSMSSRMPTPRTLTVPEMTRVVLMIQAMVPAMPAPQAKVRRDTASSTPAAQGERGCCSPSACPPGGSNTRAPQADFQKVMQRSRRHGMVHVKKTSAAPPHRAPQNTHSQVEFCSG